MTGRREMGRKRATRALVALVVAVACLGSVAYATTLSERGRPHGKGKHHARGQAQGPPRPRFIEAPPSGGIEPDSQFRFHVAPSEQRTAVPGPGPSPQERWRRFECRLDGGDWDDCGSPYLVRGIKPGEHSFAVRALNRRGLSGAVAHYRWALLEPQDLSIVPLTGKLEQLMPGEPAQPLPVRIGNPNPAPIEVTSLTVAVTPEAPDCSGDPNFAVTASSLSPAAPLLVPAGGSVSLPTAGATAPAVAMRELPVDQNACRGATVRLDFSAKARG